MATAEARKQRQATLRDQWVQASSMLNSTPPTGAPKAAYKHPMAVLRHIDSKLRQSSAAWLRFLQAPPNKCEMHGQQVHAIDSCVPDLADMPASTM